MTLEKAQHLLEAFQITTKNISITPIHQGFINDTFLVAIHNETRYILQQVNTKVFKNYQGLHHNLEKALSQLQAKDYAAINLIKTKSNKPYAIVDHTVWRLQTYIKDSVAHNFATNTTQAFEAGRILGRFHALLGQENLEQYTVTIPNFNHLPFRVEEFETALKTAPKERLDFAKKAIDFAVLNLPKLLEFYKVDLPLRLCHNDTKLNNFLFNSKDEGLCLIDLDTIMPGYFHYDFGDALRTITSETLEGELELTNIRCNLHYLEAFVKGLKASDLSLSSAEINCLPIAVSLMPFMHGLRGLTDYLNGNIYYKVSYDTQNLERCLSLFHVADLAIQNQEAIQAIIEAYF